MPPRFINSSREFYWLWEFPRLREKLFSIENLWISQVCPHTLVSIREIDARPLKLAEENGFSLLKNNIFQFNTIRGENFLRVGNREYRWRSRDLHYPRDYYSNLRLSTIIYWSDIYQHHYWKFSRWKISRCEEKTAIFLTLNTLWIFDSYENEAYKKNIGGNLKNRNKAFVAPYLVKLKAENSY